MASKATYFHWRSKYAGASVDELKRLRATGPDEVEPEQYYQAMNEWRSVLGQEPGNIEARLGLARGAAKAGDGPPPRRSISGFSRSCRISPRPGGSWPVWGVRLDS